MEKAVGYVLRRMLVLVIGIMVLLSIEFLVLRVMPGDPGQLALPRNPNVDNLQEWMNHVDSVFSKPLSAQYVEFVGDMLSGNFRTSYVYADDISGFIYDHLGRTLILFIASLSICFIFAPLLSWLVSRLRTHVHRQIVSFFPLAAFSVPVVAWAWLLGYTFTIGSSILPYGGYITPGSVPVGMVETFWEYLTHAVLPVMVISLSVVGALTLAMRDGCTRAYGPGPVTASGGSRFMDGVFAGLPNIQFMVAGTMCFVVVVEVFFAYRGLGYLFVASIHQFDYFVIQASFFLIAVVVFLSNFVIELFVTLVRPGWRLDQYLHEDHTAQSAPSAVPSALTTSSIGGVVVSLARGYLRSPVGLVALVVLLGIVVLAGVGPSLSSDEMVFPYMFSSTDLFLDGAGPLVAVSFLVGLLSAIIGLLVGIVAGLVRPFYVDAFVAGAAQGLIAIPLVCMVALQMFAVSQSSTSAESEFTVARSMMLLAAAPIALLVCHGFVSSVRRKGRSGPLLVTHHGPALASWTLGGLKYVMPMAAIAVFVTDFLGVTQLGSWGRAVDLAGSFNMYFLSGGWDYVLPSFAGMVLLVGSMFLVLDTLDRVFRSRFSGRT